MGTVRLHRVLRASPARVYKTYLDPDAMVKWLPPYGFTARVFEHEAKVGGSYKMSFRNVATGRSEGFGGKYLELVPNERIVVTDRFDDPKVAGELRVTVTLREVTVGTELTIVQEGDFGAIPLEACYLGWQESLAQLALLVEANVRD
jgi:uncharacterized protein YndB with AHSA1/START domain